MTIIANGRRFDLYKYKTEKEFEEDIVVSSKVLLGKATIYIDAKKKIESKTLGATVPDGFFFDFTDPTDPQFYIVEVELSLHGFYSHIFPQITKFFAFFNNTRVQKSLVDKLFSIIDTDPQLKAEFRKHLGHAEVYKFLSDIAESSQNILLVADGTIPELPEIMTTYTDTWGRIVRFMEVKKYTSGDDIVFSISPDVETLQYAETEEGIGNEEDEEQDTPYTEEFHLERVGQIIKEIYEKIRLAAVSLNDGVIFNPQKYYISIKAPKNIAFLKIRKKKVRFIAMMPEEKIREIVKTHSVVSLSEPVQRFYNGECAAIDVQNLVNFEEIETLLRELISENAEGA
jgi:predicted transport protein